MTERPLSEAEIEALLAQLDQNNADPWFRRLAAALRQMRAERDDYRRRLDAKLNDALEWMRRALEAEELAASLRAANAALREAATSLVELINSERPAASELRMAEVWLTELDHRADIVRWALASSVPETP